MTTEQKNQIVQMRGLGKSYYAISEALGISVNTVSAFCRKSNIDGQSKDINGVGS